MLNILIKRNFIYKKCTNLKYSLWVTIVAFTYITGNHTLITSTPEGNTVMTSIPHLNGITFTSIVLCNIMSFF